MKSEIHIRVKGKIQGVGFRPYVWQFAHQCHFNGDACNDGEGVLVHLLASADIAEFTQLLNQRIKPLLTKWLFCA